MYPNLRAELARKGATLTKVAEYLGINISTLSQKYNGKSEWSFREVIAIKKFLGTTMPLEELFAEEK